MSDIITINYGNLVKSGQNMQNLKSSFQRIEQEINKERQIHAEDKGEATDALEAQRQDLLSDLLEKQEDADQFIDLISTMHLDLSALLPAENETLDMKVDYGNAQVCITCFFEAAAACLAFIYADPCMSRHEYWVPDINGGGHYQPDEPKLARERANGVTLEGLEDILRTKRAKVAEKKELATDWFADKVMAFVYKDMELAGIIYQKHQAYKGKHPEKTVYTSAETKKVTKITIPGFPGLEIDPENINIRDIQSYINRKMFGGAWDALKGWGTTFLDSIVGTKNKVVFCITYAQGEPDPAATKWVLNNYQDTIIPLKGFFSDPIGGIKGIGSAIAAYYSDMYNKEGLAYTMGTFLPDIIIAIITFGVGAGAKGSLSALRLESDAAKFKEGVDAAVAVGKAGDTVETIKLSAGLLEKLKSSGLTNEKINEIIALGRGNRPDPLTYLNPDYVQAHLEEFQGGVTRIAAKTPTGRVGPDGGTFILPSSVVDDVIARSGGDVSMIEQALGFPKGSLGTDPVRIDIPDPEGLRMPSGNEKGANEQWIPGGYTSGELPEAIIDPPDVGQYTVKPVLSN